MDKALALRLEKIESHLTHLEEQFDQLNQVVIEQGKQLSRMQIHLRRVSSTLEAEELDRVKSTQSRPPHSR